MKSEPGQYISIHLPADLISGSKYDQCRNYSLSDEPRTYIYRITVKKETDGLISSYLHDAIAIGDIIDVGVPCGDFILKPG